MKTNLNLWYKLNWKIPRNLLRNPSSKRRLLVILPFRNFFLSLFFNLFYDRIIHSASIHQLIRHWMQLARFCKKKTFRFFFDIRGMEKTHGINYQFSMDGDMFAQITYYLFVYLLVSLSFLLIFFLFFFVVQFFLWTISEQRYQIRQLCLKNKRVKLECIFAKKNPKEKANDQLIYSIGHNSQYSPGLRKDKCGRNVTNSPYNIIFHPITMVC